MAIATLNGGSGVFFGINWPQSLWINSAFSLSSMSAAAHYRALSFIAPKAGDLSKFHFRTGTVTTGDDLHISFQNADSNGNPDGAVDQYRVITVDSADDNVWKTTGIISSNGTDGGAKRTVAAGDRICVVIRFNSYVAGSLWLQYMADAAVSGYSTFLQSTNSGSTWSEVNGAMDAAIEYADGTIAYLKNTAAVESFTTTSTNTGSTPDEYSLRFRLPYPVRVAGVEIKGASTDCSFALYPDSGSALASGEPVIKGTTSLRRSLIFSSPVDLDANVYYRIGWKPTTGTNRSLQLYNLNSAAIREAFDLGLNFSLGTRVDAGAWSDDTAKFMLATLICIGADDGSSGGAGCSYGALSNGTRVVPVAQ